METVFLVLGAALIIVVIYLSIKIQHLSSSSNRDGLHQSMDRLNQNMSENLQSVTLTVLNQLNEVTKQVNSRLKENTQELNQRLKESSILIERSHRSMGERLDNAAKVVSSVTNKLSSLEEANKKIFDVGKDIAQLQEILRAPKLRGILGEFFLHDILAQIFTKDNYVLQYTFSNGTKVDAVVKLHNDMMVPIDAKFPLENFKKMLEADNDESREKFRKIFNNDVKRHISDIAHKYILPDEGTFDFALMYIPAENVYYETIIKGDPEKDVFSFALQKRVIPVSPYSFYIYLQSILMGLRGLRIEKEAKKIWMYLSSLKGDFQQFDEQFSILGKHLMHAKSTYDTSEKKLDRFGQRLLQTNEEKSEEVISLPRDEVAL